MEHYTNNKMITDNKTNFVYFSALLPQRYPKFFQELEAVLREKRIEYGLLPHTKDIWCRDYMPVQTPKGDFVQFNYDPRYLKPKRYWRRRTNAAKTCRAIGIRSLLSDIRLDGGNVVMSRTKAILTDRIFHENTHYLKDKLIKELKRLLKVRQVIIIPECLDDLFGHADGMVRFLSEDTVLVNDYSHEPAFQKNLYRSLKGAKLDLKPIPYNPYCNKGELNATGIYINYLQVCRTILCPIYGMKEDALAHEVFLKYFGANVIPIRANAIAKKGGVLNCVSWNIFKERN